MRHLLRRGLGQRSVTQDLRRDVLERREGHAHKPLPRGRREFFRFVGTRGVTLNEYRASLDKGHRRAGAILAKRHHAAFSNHFDDIHVSWG